MSPPLRHECIRVPVTALAAVGPLLFAAEGPVVRCYRSDDVKKFTYVGSKRVFKSHAIHGIAAHQVDLNSVTLAIWGGPLIRFLQFDPVAFSSRIDLGGNGWGSSIASPIVRAPDWILDLSLRPASTSNLTEGDVIICAAVTAHNALIEVTVQQTSQDEGGKSTLVPRLSESTSSSRSILYSAHLLWDSDDHVLVAAGTAFGEIIFWSWTKDAIKGSYSCILRVFLGHEGSIFGVRISEEINDASGNTQRYLASCSDDRTIRIWDLSGIQTCSAVAHLDTAVAEAERTRHTGFSSETFDADISNSPCLAIGWGHLSRVWAVIFVRSRCSPNSICLLSSGEDATSRAWQFSPRRGSSQEADTSPIKLIQVGTAAYHSGKNIWSSIVFGSDQGAQQVVCGAAESKITAYPLPTFEVVGSKAAEDIAEYTLQDIVSMDQGTSLALQTSLSNLSLKRVKADDFIRAYALLDSTSFLLTTNTGKVFLETITPGSDGHGAGSISKSELIQQLDEGSGHSVCVAEPSLGVGFVGGARGGIYMYHKSAPSVLKRISTVQGKIGDLFIGLKTTNDSFVLVVSLMGRNVAQYIHISTPQGGKPHSIVDIVDLVLPEAVTGTTITSMAWIPLYGGPACVVLGFRGGSVAGYSLPCSADQTDRITASVTQKFHGKEAVTSLLWYPCPDPSSPFPSEGYLISVGRDGCCAIHHLILSKKPHGCTHCDFQGYDFTFTLTHHLPFPFGPTLEGLYLDDTSSNLFIYGFSSTKFILYNLTTEEEIMNVETGGAHRSWAFHPPSYPYYPPGSEKGRETVEGEEEVGSAAGGTLVWTRASTTHIYAPHHLGANHSVIRTGGHGREIKAVAVSPTNGLIATGAEDTDIKLFSYDINSGDGKEKDLRALRTLRKHKTGIQHLQWSDDGEYLFSSGGAEEFFVWRVRKLPRWIGYGVVCEAEIRRESLDVEVRCLGFDVRREDDGFVIALVFSDSTIRIHTYNTSTCSFSTVLRTTYATSCLTQTVFLSPTTLLTAGTDGHAVLWPLPLDRVRQQDDGNCKYHSPLRLHQNSSKTLGTHPIPHTWATLLVSGGDDGSIALFIATPQFPPLSPFGTPSLATTTPSPTAMTIHPPAILARAHASAVTALAIIPAFSSLSSKSHPSPSLDAASTPETHTLHVLTSGTDQWLRLWSVSVRLPSEIGKVGEGEAAGPDIRIQRAGKLKTHVADVSSMAVLGYTAFSSSKGGDTEGQESTGKGRGAGSDTGTGSDARVVVCGVGMEVVRVGGCDEDGEGE
ncbi:WD40 repeat-like protein [Westerdykella ornata]|uniref:WD40 repeat-like protein n=1 Tax=Westerdykella ornata TaxID=318751 RepID=A0A6A6JHB1_WESOR|nr:WD40 repeat-like protein [Westerdykella ornata]KAF2275036.1 WD40 repeat-like protein [Westerdykella ornata]